MQEIWHEISIERSTDGSVLAEAWAGASSPWFSGHFSEAPVLPAIAVLSMVKDAISNHEAEQGRDIRVSAIHRVRFRLPTKPDDLLKISVISLDHPGQVSYQFKVEVDGQTTCTGRMAVEMLWRKNQGT
jgi:3-hydroxymyristoyl/3-hydroxydecanoyl-(acyl carrier protein) dehydratase